jgi:serine/threonine protein kinase
MFYTKYRDQQIELDINNPIKQGGQGKIYEIANLPESLAKIYTKPMDSELIEKLQIMIENPPKDEMREKGHIMIAWPTDILLNNEKKPIGFIMPKITNSKTLYHVYHPGTRKEKAPRFNWLYLHTTALNVAIAVEAIHHKGYVIGDLKTDNILVKGNGLVSLIDTDSFQVYYPPTNNIYYCTVGSELFTPPELIGKDLRYFKREEYHDRFGLAVIIYLLLFGYDPYQGKQKNGTEIEDSSVLVRNGYWLYGKNTPLSPASYSHPLKILYPELQELFHDCFTKGHENPLLRPTATKWKNCLRSAIKELKECSKNKNHYYHGGDGGSCYWCARKNKFNHDLFPPVPKTKEEIEQELQKVQTLLELQKILEGEQLEQEQLELKERLKRLEGEQLDQEQLEQLKRLESELQDLLKQEKQRQHKLEKQRKLEERRKREQELLKGELLKLQNNLQLHKLYKLQKIFGFERELLELQERLKILKGEQLDQELQKGLKGLESELQKLLDQQKQRKSELEQLVSRSIAVVTALFISGIVIPPIWTNVIKPMIEQNQPNNS